MFAYSAACFITRSKVWRLVLFVLISVTVCQISVTVKRAQIDQNFKQQLKENPTGAFVGDIVHGFKRIAGIRDDIKNSFIEARNGDEYTGFESINYRYATMAVMGFLMFISLVFRKTSKVPSYIKEKPDVKN